MLEEKTWKTRPQCHIKPAKIALNILFANLLIKISLYFRGKPQQALSG